MIVIFQKYSTLVIFVVFGSLVFFQHLFMDMYFDDYGLASLSYAKPDFDLATQKYELIDIIKYLSYHYNNWGGRILFLFIGIVLLRAGLLIFTLVQSIIIVGIFYLIYKIIKQNIKSNKPDWLLALTCVAIYGTVGILTFRDAIFWASASIFYVFPTLFFLYFVYLFGKLKDKRSNKSYLKITMPIVAFVASFSQEQVGFAMFVFIAVNVIFDLFKNKRNPNFWILLALSSSIVGVLLLLLAPGNIERANTSSLDFYSKGIFEKLSIASSNIVSYILGGNNLIFLTLVLFFGIFLSYMIHSNTTHRIILRNVSTLLFIGILFIFLLSIQRSLAYFVENRSLYFFLLSSILISIVLLTIYLLQNNKYVQLLILLISGVASQSVMLMAPYYPHRSYLFFMLVFFTICISVIFSNSKARTQTLFIFLLPVILFSFYNYTNITIGYYNNSSVNRFNRSRLISASNDIRQGKLVPVIYLKKIPNAMYAQTMPYEDDYTLRLLKNYYMIPQNTNIIYE